MTIVELSCIVCGEEIPEEVDLHEDYDYICFACMNRVIDYLCNNNEPRVLH